MYINSTPFLFGIYDPQGSRIRTRLLIPISKEYIYTNLTGLTWTLQFCLQDNVMIKKLQVKCFLEMKKAMFYIM